MKNFLISFTDLIGNLPIINRIRRINKLLTTSKSSISSLEQDVNNWGKTAAYLPETGECYLSISLCQFEEERVKSSVLA